VDHHASRLTAIIDLAIERENLAAIGARRAHGLFEPGEATLREVLAGASRRNGDLDADRALLFGFAMQGQEDRIAEFALTTQPQPVVEAFHRRFLADIDLMILRRCNRRSIAALPHQLRERRCLPAIFLVDAEEPDRRREQLVEGDLNIGPHVTGKLPDRGDQPALRNPGKVPGERIPGTT
jgi:hypothetical protein